MNIDEYYAIRKAEAEKVVEEIPAETEPQAVVPEPTEPESTEPTPTEVHQEETPVPTKLVIDGVEYDAEKIAELQQRALNSDDLLKKVQTNPNQENAILFYESIKNNPALAQKLLSDELIKNSPIADLLDSSKQDLRAKDEENRNLRVKLEINELEKEHGQFDVAKVLQTAIDNKLPDLRTAYNWVKNSQPQAKQDVDINALTKQIEENLRKSLQAEFDAKIKESNTTSLIKQQASGGGHVEEIKLTPEEEKVRIGFKMTKEQFIENKTR